MQILKIAIAYLLLFRIFLLTLNDNDYINTLYGCSFNVLLSSELKTITSCIISGTEIESGRIE